MWVNKTLFDTILSDNKAQADAVVHLRMENYGLHKIHEQQSAQKAKDDMTIDWMRHRINALEKEKALLFARAAGIHIPVPEIVPTRPGTMSVPDFQSLMPSFEDVGDEEALRLGVKHDPDGYLVDKK